MGARRQSRELALMLLYSREANRETDDDSTLAAFRGRVPSSALEYARRLAAGVAAHSEELERLIGEKSRNWRLDRIARIDRAILKLAVYELLFEDAVPSLVSIDEAVELAKKFSTGQSGAFINGMLDEIRKRHGKGVGKE